MTYDFKVSIDFPEETIEWMAIWHCHLDACPKCQNLNGYPFNGVGLPPQVLMHPQWGPVWDIESDTSLVHPNCRCTVDGYMRISPSKIPIVHEFAQRLNMPELDVEEITDLAKLRDLSAGVKGFIGDIDELNTALRRYLMLARRVGLPENITQGLTVLQQARMSVYQISRAESMIASGTPIGAITGGAMLATTALFTLDQLQQMGAQYREDILKAIANEQTRQLAEYQLEMRRKRY